MIRNAGQYPQVAGKPAVGTVERNAVNCPVRATGGRPLKERFPSMAVEGGTRGIARAEPSYERLRRGSFFQRAAEGG